MSESDLAAYGRVLLLLGTILVPLLVATGLAFPSGRVGRLALALAPWAAAPGLLAALAAGEVEIAAPSVLLHLRLGIDSIGQAFLGFTAFLWLVAGVFARGYIAQRAARRRFFAFFLPSMAGNLGLVMALDAVSFFVFFTLMSLASYGVVVHERTADALRAGRIYIVLAIAGEVMLFSGIALLAGSMPVADLAFPLSSPRAADPLVLTLLFVGFGIKAGLLPVHVWLPLAHPAAPTPASAVLSGAMIKAGVLGWIRFLPLGTVALPSLGWMFIALGLLAAFYAVVVGAVQRSPKTVLAYSSISQMGYLTVGVGAGLLAPTAWPQLLAAIVVYAAHHGLAKGALFLGLGAAATATRRTAVAVGLLVPALALAGAPLTSGALAKALLVDAVAEADAAILARWSALLSLAAVGTAALMVRMLIIACPAPGHAHRLTLPGWAAWGVSVLAVVVGVHLLPGIAEEVVGADRGLGLASAWPLGAGVALALVARVLVRRIKSLPAVMRIPAGDVLAPVERGVAVGLARLRRAGPVAAWRARASREVSAGTGRLLPTLAKVCDVERRLGEWPWVGFAFFGLFLLLSLL